MTSSKKFMKKKEKEYQLNDFSSTKRIRKKWYERDQITSEKLGT